jgi:hypothetical protein
MYQRVHVCMCACVHVGVWVCGCVCVGVCLNKRMVWSACNISRLLLLREVVRQREGVDQALPDERVALDGQRLHCVRKKFTRQEMVLCHSNEKRCKAFGSHSRETQRQSVVHKFTDLHNLYLDDGRCGLDGARVVLQHGCGRQGDALEQREDVLPCE